MWLYYYIMMGPGHQSQDDGFRYFPDSIYDDIETARDSLREEMENRYYYTNFTLRSWEVEAPPASYVNKRISDIKDNIVALEKRLKMLEEISCFNPAIREDVDETLKKNMNGKVEHDVLYRLHKSKLMFTIDDVKKWRKGENCPVEPCRKKVLNIIRRSKSYQSA